LIESISLRRYRLREDGKRYCRRLDPSIWRKDNFTPQLVSKLLLLSLFLFAVLARLKDQSDNKPVENKTGKIVQKPSLSLASCLGRKGSITNFQLQQNRPLGLSFLTFCFSRSIPVWTFTFWTNHRILLSVFSRQPNMTTPFAFITL